MKYSIVSILTLLFSCAGIYSSKSQNPVRQKLPSHRSAFASHESIAEEKGDTHISLAKPERLAVSSVHLKKRSGRLNLTEIRNDLNKMEGYSGVLNEGRFHGYQSVNEVDKEDMDHFLRQVANNSIADMPNLRFSDQVLDQNQAQYITSTMFLMEEYQRERRNGGSGWESMEKNLKNQCRAAAKRSIFSLSQFRARHAKMRCAVSNMGA